MTTSGRVLLADDSPHAQRMGERILREEGFEVVTVTDGETAIIRLKDVDPDVVIVDAFLPQVSGYDLCGFIKKQPQHSRVKVLLTSTALERVDEDQAYKAGADGQLKKPFEASVMLKSLKDLIGGSDKKKRAGTTSLDLSYNGEETPARPESAGASSDVDESSGEKHVSALQAWLQQHDSGSYSDSAPAEAPVEEKHVLASAAAGGVEEVTEDSTRISNPQLLRRAEDEPEDLSLRNNPVARLRYSAKPSPAEARQAEPVAEPASESPKSDVRSFRIQPVAVPPAELEPAKASDEPSRAPRKSLLEQLEEFEKATSESGEELAPTTPFAKSSAAAASPPVTDTPDPGEAQKSGLDEEVDAALAAQQVEEEPGAAVSVEDSEPEGEDEEEEFLLMRPRTGRSGRPSLLEALGAPAPDESILEETDAEPIVSNSVEAVSADPIAEETSISTATAAAIATLQEASVISLDSAGVRLDDEEVRAVVEIAVSAAMPAIVEEVSRCVLLALESRYADKLPANGDR